ncbi:MAG: GntR family transcriptional regulator, partial [Micromonosporaceae bacterium]
MDRSTDAAAADAAVPLTELLGDWMTGAGPLFRRLADALAGRIGDGTLGADQRLPAERALAAQLAVSRATVVAAYD